MITSYEAFLKRVKIEDSFYIIPIEVEKKLRELDAENEELKKETAQLIAQKNADEYETAARIIMNLRSDKMGTSKVLSNTEFGILDDFWAELENRIVHALREETINGEKYRPDMLPRISGNDAEAFIASRRKAQHINDNGIMVEAVADDPRARRKKRKAVEIIK